ncbi:MAG: AAA-associated domain-containing protein [Sulfolobaceae archaeon]|nr:AAA-associated domain-containing protein [Sulfolobaceae archaeon]
MDVIDPNSRVADLLGLLTTLINDFEGRADIFLVEKEMEVDMDDLMPIVYSAAALGFVTVGEGDIIITDKGIEFVNSNIKHRKELLRESLKEVEPFETAIELKEFTISQLLNELQKKGITKYQGPTAEYDLEVILSEWGIYSGLLVKRDDKYIVKEV